MSFRIEFSQLRAVDANGDPVAGAKAYFYTPGTSTPATVYTDATLSTAHPTPLLADGSGIFAPVFCGSAVKVDVTDADGAAVPGFPLDPASSIPSVNGSGEFEVGSFSSTGATNGTRIAASVIDTSRDTNSTAAQLRAYNPSGLIFSVLTSTLDAIIRAANRLIIQTNSTTRLTVTDTAVTAASGVVFTGNGSGLTNIDAAAVSGNGSSISTLSGTAVGNAVAGLASGAVGTTLLARYGGATSPIAVGTTVSGSDLAPASADGTSGGTTPSGTWMCAGRATTASDVARTTLWRRTV